MNGVRLVSQWAVNKKIKQFNSVPKTYNLWQVQRTDYSLHSPDRYTLIADSVTWFIWTMGIHAEHLGARQALRFMMYCIHFWQHFDLNQTHNKKAQPPPRQWTGNYPPIIVRWQLCMSRHKRLHPMKTSIMYDNTLVATGCIVSLQSKWL